MRPTRTFRAAAACLGVASVVAASGCGGDKPAYCQDRDDLKSSVDQLKKIDVRGDGLSAAQKQVKQVQTDATTLAGSAKKEFQPEATALKGAVTTLAGSVDDAASNPSAATVSVVATQAAGVKTAFTSLSDAISDTC